jgi:RTX calcium-binding nonapeptide repeat (4 copies)
MLPVAFPRRTRTLIGTLAAVTCAVATVPGMASAGTDELAAGLIRLDPGARLGGNTQVATAARARVSGVRGRVNFMMGLGHRQHLVGGAGHDQIGARGASGARIHGGRGHDLIHGSRGHDQLHGGHGHDRIHAGHGHDVIHAGHGHDRIHGGHGNDRLIGGHGHDRIYGGAGRDRLEGGPGRNRLIDRQGHTIVVAGPGRNHVDVADGSRDRVLCVAGSINRIVVDRGDRLQPRCHGPASVVRYQRPPSGAPPADPPAAQAAQSVSGDGSSANPYVAECTEPQKVNCTTPLFAARSLSGLWANEYVPAYKCPPSHPYLYDESYAPAGTSLPHGVGVLGLGPIGMSITGFKTTKVTTSDGITSGYTTGTDTGFPNSSATNWTTGTNSYQVQLHCTSSTANAVFLGYS